MQVRSPSDARAVAVATVALLLVSLVALASGGSPWHAGGRQDVPAGIVSALAAVAGALLVGSLLLAWVGTPSVEKRRRRRRVEAKDLEGLGASLSTAGRTAAVVIGAIGLFLLLVLPFLVPSRPTPPGITQPGGAAPPAGTTGSAPAPHVTSTSLTWLVVGSAAALLLLAPAAFVVRRRRARRERREVAPDAAAQVALGLRRSLAELESEDDPRRAVELAYAHMEESLGEVELSRAPDETPSEFTSRVLRVLGASAAAASDLTGLFEIARFSDHAMDEDDRRRAIASVRRVEKEVEVR